MGGNGRAVLPQNVEGEHGEARPRHGEHAARPPLYENKRGSPTRGEGEKARVESAADGGGEAVGPERGVEAARDGDEGENGGVGGDVEDEAEAVGGRSEELAREQHGEVRREQRRVGKL